MARQRFLKRALVTGIACLACVAPGCSGPDAPAPAVIRLWERQDAALVAAPPRAPAVAPAVLYDARSAAATEGFLLSGDVTDPRAPAGPELAFAATELDGAPALRLAGPQGIATRVLAVEGAREYELSAAVRGTQGSKVLAVELDRAGAPDELFTGEEGREHVVAVHELLPGEGRKHVTLRTTPHTRALALMYVLQPAPDGQDAFLEVAGAVLRAAAPEAFWRELAREYARESSAGAAPLSGWRAERFVRTPLCRDVRPSILLLPGESLSFELRVPRGRPVLRAGLGPWQTGGDRAPVFGVEVDGRRVASATVAADGAEWQDLAVDLAAEAGKAVRLTLRVDGTGPGVFGAPMVVDRANVPAGKNVILVSIDTLRADHLGAYGYERDTSPHLDALAASSLFFADATAQAPYTLPSHVTMLSGQFPSVHGVEEMGHVVTSERTTLLSETLAARGYRTMAFTGGGYVASPFGLDRGFDRFVTIDAFKPWDADTRCGGLSGPDAFLSWIRSAKDERFLLFLHTFVVHNYDPPARFEGRFRSADDIDLRRWVRGRYARFNGIPDAALQRVVDAYDEAIAYADDVVGRLLATLEAEGIDDETIVVVTSDHGEELFDRGSIQHGDTLYEELTRVPLIVHVPGAAPRRIETPVMVVDVTPTILGALGLPPDPRMQGVDLSKGRVPERSIWSEVTHKTHQYALRDPAGWKMIFAPREGRATPLFEKEEEWELFRLGSDPLERRALDGDQPDQAERMRAAVIEMRRRLEAYGESLGSVDVVPLGVDDVRDLRKLGYM